MAKTRNVSQPNVVAEPTMDCRRSSNIFGKANVGVVFGWVFAAHQFGAAIAASAAGVMRTWLGSYQITFLSAGVLCLMAAGLVIRIGRGTHDAHDTRGESVPSLSLEPSISSAD